jgi:predicted transglutaminase-like cysteine proteinase
MAVVIDEDGAGQAVLMVRTNRGELVLDNKTEAVLPWSETACPARFHLAPGHP